MKRRATTRPRVAVALQDPKGDPSPALTRLKNRRYLEAVERHGAVPIAIDSRSSDAARQEAWASMDGLLLTGGPDIDPARYRATSAGTRRTDPQRDALDEEGFRAAERRRVPVLGICRGLQAINVFSGGSLVQHVEGHEGAPYPKQPVPRHALRVLPGTRLAEILGSGTRGVELVVNSYHHQAVGPNGVAPGLKAVAVAPDRYGGLVEGIEASQPDRWLVAVQCHPERESSPVELERLLAAFVDACRR